jgi:hypothetical protein
MGALLNRETPSLEGSQHAGGLALYTGLLDRGLGTRTQVVQAIENSPEYHTVEITNLHESVLRRAPDPVGLAGWVNFLDQGASAEQLQAQLLGSDEYFIRIF